MGRSLTALILVIQLSLSAWAQQPNTSPQGPSGAEQKKVDAPQQPARPSDDDVVRITTNLVQVDAVITDKKGKLVTDLREDEVEIREDSQPQKITNFSFVALETPEVVQPPKPVDKVVDKAVPPTPAVRLRPEQVRRTIALVVDDLGLSFESTYYVRRALRKFLDQQMQDGDLVAIMRTGGGIGALQQFTSDKRQLYAAVEKVKWNPIGRGKIGAFAPIGDDGLRLSGRNAMETESDQRAGEDIDQFREDIFAVGTLGALNYIVRGLRELPGRKSVLLISDGIRIFNFSDPTWSSRILERLRRLTDLANRASVVIYTMDARGLQVLGLTAADSTSGLTMDQVERQLSNRRAEFFESQSGLTYLAQQTGGLAIRNNNDLNAGIKRVLEDQNGYYLIGYRPDESTFDSVSGRRKFHKLSLKVNRPGKFNVRMRNGFFGITDEEAVPFRKTPQQQLIGALTSPFGSAGVQLKLTSLFANTQELGSFMRSIIHVDAGDLTFTKEPDGWHKAMFEIIAVTFGDNGVIIDQVNKGHSIRARNDVFERLLKEGFVYNVVVPLKKPGGHQLRVALRDDASERVGSASQFVEVPDIKKNRLALSGILVRGISEEIYKKQALLSNEQRDANEQTNTTDPLAGAAVRQFQRSYVMEYGFVIYNAQIDKSTGKPNVKAQIRVFRNGEQVFDGKELPVESNQSDLKRLTAGGALQLGTDMIPGEYILQIIVTDSLANEKRRVATQWIDFEIIK